MKAVVYDKKTGEVHRRINGREEVLSNQVLSNNESIITENDVDSFPTSFENIKVEHDKETFVYSVSISNAKAEKISEIKNRAYAILSQTDWYIIRSKETGEAIPKDVREHRSQVRANSDSFEQEINNLQTVEEVLNYEYSFPEPPEP